MGMRRVLLERFPAAFKGFGEPKVPLKINIYEDITAAAPELPRDVVRWAVRDYCHGRTYHAAMHAGAERIDLHGVTVDMVSQSQAQHHALHLARISAHKAANAKAKGGKPGDAIPHR